MKDIKVIDSEKSLAKLDLDLLEQKLGFNLPAEYKDFLLLHNGGHPEKDCYPTNNMNLEGANIAWFYAFYDGEYENLLKEVERHENIIPKDFIPIGRGSGGNEICLGISGCDMGKLYFFITSLGIDENDIPFPNNMYLISNTFTDFINSLYYLDSEGKINEEGIFRRKKSIAIHDKYSLPFSIHVKKHGSLVTDFFAKAPPEIEDYIIEEHEASKVIVLYYDVKLEGKRYKRVIRVDGHIEDDIENIPN
jgi:hypothetical protein